jgi:hypothetical protein
MHTIYNMFLTSELLIIVGLNRDNSGWLVMSAEYASIQVCDHGPSIQWRPACQVQGPKCL